MIEKGTDESTSAHRKSYRNRRGPFAGSTNPTTPEPKSRFSTATGFTLGSEYIIHTHAKKPITVPVSGKIQDRHEIFHFRRKTTDNPTSFWL